MFAVPAHADGEVTNPWWYDSYGDGSGASCQKSWVASSADEVWKGWSSCVQGLGTPTGATSYTFVLDNCTLRQAATPTTYGMTQCHFHTVAVWSAGGTDLMYHDIPVNQCPTNSRFVPKDSSNGKIGGCAPFIDRFWYKPDRCDGIGNPIYPLTGVKQQPQPLGVQIGGSEVALTFDSHDRIPEINSRPTWMVKGAPSFGELWRSSLHRSLVFQQASGAGVGSANTGVAMHRGEGQWVTFTPDGAGGYVSNIDPSDKLLPMSGGWRFWSARGLVQEDYDSVGKVKSIATASGLKVNLAYSDTSTPVSSAPLPGLLIGATDSFGRSIAFAYQSSTGSTALIKSLTAPDGGVTTFAYDALDNLKSIGWPDSQVRAFAYERSDLPWALTGVVDENNRRFATFSYDTKGRAISTEHAGGTDKFVVDFGSVVPGWNIVETYDVAHDVIWRDHYWQLPSAPSVIDPMSQHSDWVGVNVAGRPRVSKQSQPAGAGCSAATSQRTFDVTGNVASRDDFNGSRSCYLNDQTRGLVLASVEGLSAATACESVLAEGATLPAGSRKTSMKWHPDWALVTAKTEPSRFTTLVYNGQADRFAGGVASCVVGGAVLPDGKPIAVLCKKVEQATTDVNGGNGLMLDGSPGTLADSSFGSVSLLLHGDGTDGSSSVVDSSSRPKSMIVGGSIQNVAAGARFGTSLWKPSGSSYVRTPTTDDLLFGTSPFTFETWIKTGQAYSGQPFRVWDARSGSSGMAWVIDATNNMMLFGHNGVYWGSAATATVTPGVWNHIAVTYDGSTVRTFVNGVVASSDAASINHTVAGDAYIGYSGAMSSPGGEFYVDEFRITKGVARYTSAFPAPTAPFANGAVGTPGVPSQMDTSVPNRVWTYTYNQYGQVLTAKGPRTDVNDTTTYVYYGDTTADHTLGDLQTVTNAAGHQTKYTKYDKAGRVLQSIDAAGVTTDITYKPRGWVESVKVTPAGGGTAQLTTYSYDAAGQLKQVSMPDGTSLQYSYDDAHRLTQVTDQAGNTVTYTLDNAGNKTGESLKDASGTLVRNITRVFDALGRVQQAVGVSK